MPSKPPVHKHAGYRPQQQQRRETDRARYDRNSEQRKFYMRTWWKNRTRPAQLSAQPLCEICEPVFRRTTLATDVHHVRPGPYTDEADFNGGPFASLCADCHREITAAIAHNRMPFHGAVGVDGWRIADQFADLWRRLGAPAP